MREDYSNRLSSTTHEIPCSLALNLLLSSVIEAATGRSGKTLREPGTQPQAADEGQSSKKALYQHAQSRVHCWKYHLFCSAGSFDHKLEGRGLDSVFSFRQYQVLQNLYNTVNTQREVAEKLAHRVTLQMNELNISSTSTSASQRTAQPAATGILRSLGVNLEEEKTSCNGALFGSPVMKQGLSSRDSTESALQTPSRQQSPREALSAHLDTTRRRRDSMDMVKSPKSRCCTLALVFRASEIVSRYLKVDDGHKPLTQK